MTSKDTLTEARPLPRAPSGGGASFPPDPAATDNPLAEFDRQFSEVFKETE